MRIPHKIQTHTNTHIKPSVYKVGLPVIFYVPEFLPYYDSITLRYYQ